MSAEKGSAESPAGALPLASAIGTRTLLIVIVTMPLFFMAVLGGAILLFGRHRERPVEAPAVETVTAPAPISLPAGGRIGALSLDGDRLAIRVETAEGGEIIIYDLARGGVLQRIEVAEEDAGR